MYIHSFSKGSVGPHLPMFMPSIPWQQKHCFFGPRTANKRCFIFLSPLPPSPRLAKIIASGQLRGCGMMRTGQGLPRKSVDSSFGVEHNLYIHQLHSLPTNASINLPIVEHEAPTGSTDPAGRERRKPQFWVVTD